MGWRRSRWWRWWWWIYSLPAPHTNTKAQSSAGRWKPACHELSPLQPQTSPCSAPRPPSPPVCCGGLGALAGGEEHRACPPQLADPPLWAHRRSPRCTAGSRTTTLSSSKCSPSLPRHEGRRSPSPSSRHLPRYRPLRLSPRPESTRGRPLGVCAVLQAPSPIQKKRKQTKKNLLFPRKS